VSQLDAQILEIDEVKYEVYMLPPLLSHDLLMDVMKMVGPAIGPVLDKLFSGGRSAGEVLDMEVDAAFFSKAASALFSGIDKKVLGNVIKELSKVTIVAPGGNLNKIFDFHFKGELDKMYKWLAFGMKVQWGKSLGALVNAVPQVPQGAKEESPSPKT
jgi:hypothetical protein